jgi:4-hydroxybenzoate polyprenyltransferase
MRIYNLYFGLILLIVFFASGYYLKEYFKPQNINHLSLRMEIRANHIYILFISLLNIISYKSELSKGKNWTVYLDISFRLLLMFSGLIAIYAFLFDHNGDLIGRKATLSSVVLSLSSIVVFLANELIYNIENTKTTNR